MSCKPGTLILQSPSYAHVISSSSVDSVCDQCLSSPNIFDNVAPVRLSRCSKCRVSYYCNVQCQRLAWPRHKLECSYLTRISPRTPPALVRLMLRILFRHRAEPDYHETLPDGSVRTLQDLVTHKKQILSSNERAEAFSSFLPVIRACVGDMFSSDELLTTFCTVLINSTEITDDMGNSVGTGLYLGLSAVDHSCAPNVNVVFHKNSVELRSMTEIPVPVWSQVRVNYLNRVLPRHMRQSRLLEDYYFNCHCHLCSSDDGPMDEYCDKAEALSEVFDDQLDDTELVKMFNKMRTVFSVYDHRMVEYSEKVMAACLNLGQYEMFYTVGEYLLKAYDEYFHPHSVSYGLHLAKLAKVAIYLDHTSDALQYLNKCFKIFKLSHGENSLMLSYLHSLRDSISL